MGFPFPLPPYQAPQFQGWKNGNDQAEFQSLIASGGVGPGTYWGEDGKYQVVEGHKNEWGKNHNPPGYSFAAHLPARKRSPDGSGVDSLGMVVLKRTEPKPSADPEPARRPPAEPRPSSPSVYAAAPSLADALAGQEEKERRRDGASRPGLQAALDSALRINRREPADWRDAGSGRAADGAGGEDDRDRPGRRFAASSHWRSQLDAVRRRLDEDQAISFA